MNKKYLVLLLSFAFAAGLLLAGCGKDNINSSGVGNAIAKKVGGTATVSLPPNTKLINVSWKTDPKSGKSSLYYLYRPMRDNEFPETYRYQEDSTWGVLESTVVIKESRSEKK